MLMLDSTNQTTYLDILETYLNRISWALISIDTRIRHAESIFFLFDEYGCPCMWEFKGTGSLENNYIR